MLSDMDGDMSHFSIPSLQCFWCLGALVNQKKNLKPCEAKPCEALPYCKRNWPVKHQQSEPPAPSVNEETKFGGGIAGAIIGLILAAFHYDGQDAVAIQGAIPGIKMLMSYIPTIVALLGAAIMLFYPLNQKKMDEITIELNGRREKELSA